VIKMELIVFLRMRFGHELVIRDIKLSSSRERNVWTTQFAAVPLTTVYPVFRSHSFPEGSN